MKKSNKHEVAGRSSHDSTERNDYILRYLLIIERLASKGARAWGRMDLLDDLVDKGIKVLLESEKTFDEKKGILFSIYVYLGIKKAIDDFLFIEIGDKEIKRLAKKVAWAWGRMDKLEDVISVGRLAFLEAKKKFKLGKGTLITSYAYHGMKGAMNNFLLSELHKGTSEKDRSRIYYAFRVRKVHDIFMQHLDEKPKEEELAVAVHAYTKLISSLKRDPTYMEIRKEMSVSKETVINFK